MTEKLSLPEFPASNMFVGGNRPMTIEWQEFFRALFKRVGGISGPDSTAILLLNVIEAFSAPVNYNKRISELEKLITLNFFELFKVHTITSHSDVDLTGLVDNDLWQWHDASLKWIAKSIAEVILNQNINPGNITMNDDAWIGIGAALERIIFDATDDSINFAGGEITLLDTSRVINHLRIGAGNWKSGAAGPTIGYEGVFVTLDFDAASDDEVFYTVLVPFRWDSTTDIEFAVDWFYDGVQDNGTVCWGIEYKSIEAGEAVTGVGTTITKTSAGNHTTGQMVRTIFTSKILATNLNCCDSFGIRLYRDVSEGTLTTDARGINSHFHFITNKLGKAT